MKVLMKCSAYNIQNRHQNLHPVKHNHFLLFDINSIVYILTIMENSLYVCIIKYNYNMNVRIFVSLALYIHT